MKPRAFRSIALFMAVAVIAAVASFAQPGPSVEAINRASRSMSIELNPSDRFVRPSDNEIEVTITLSNLRVGAPYYLDVGVYSAEGYVRGCNGDGMKQRHNFRRVSTSMITRTAKVSLSPRAIAFLKNNGRRGAGFRSGTTSTAFNLCWTRRIQPRQPQIQTLVVASR